MAFEQFIALDIILDGDNCWPDLRDGGFIDGQLEGIAALPNGTAAGNPTVTLRVRLPNGRVALAQTTLRLFLTASDAFRAKYGTP